MWVLLLIAHTITKSSMAQACGIRAAKDVLRKKLKRALASLSEQEKLEQSKCLVRKVTLTS